MKDDVLSELLEDSEPEGATKRRALAAQELYQRAADVAPRLDIRLSALRVELWTRKGRARQCLHASAYCLSFDGLAWKMELGFPPVKGPSYGAFGKAFAMVPDTKPELVKSAKQPRKELWKVPLWRWVENTTALYDAKRVTVGNPRHFTAEYVFKDKGPRYYDPDCGNHFLAQEAADFPSVIMRNASTYLVRCHRCQSFLNAYHEGKKQL